jgi:hypothetical protein
MVHFLVRCLNGDLKSEHHSGKWTKEILVIRKGEILEECVRSL